jgi:hypothetical protein
MRIIGRTAAMAVLALGLAGCASSINTSEFPNEPATATAQNDVQKPLQCVPYAREHSDVKIYGDAYSWWDKAAGHYPRGSLPVPGAVMVLNNYAGAQRGHVAVVRQLVGPREIRVDHANWLDDGAIYVNDPVQDVSSANDWSAVRVYNIKTGGWGTKLYPVQGFIGGGDRPDLVAQAAPGATRGATALVGEIN